MDLGSISSHSNQSEKELSIHDASKGVTQNHKLDELNKKYQDTKSKDQQLHTDYKEHHNLETLDEQDQVEDMHSKTSNELN